MITHRPPPAEMAGSKLQTAYVEHAIVPLTQPKLDSIQRPSSKPTSLTAEPLTAAAFAPYGSIIQAFSSPSFAPPGVEVGIANQGTAFKFNRLAKIEETYPSGKLDAAGTGLSIGLMRQDTHWDIENGAEIVVRTLERHVCTTQAFVPMGKTAPHGASQLPPGGAIIVVVALNGEDDKPDRTTMKAFSVTACQGVSYNAGTWHAQSDYICVEAQLGDGSDPLDLQQVTPTEPFAIVTVPPYTGRKIPIAPPTTAFTPLSAPSPSSTGASTMSTYSSPSSGLIHPQPLTPAAFASFGQVIQPYPHPHTSASASSLTGIPPKMQIRPNPKGKAVKYTNLASITSTYPSDIHPPPQTAISVMRATPKDGLERGKVFDIRLMERHPYTTQAFIPMGKAESLGTGEGPLPPGGAFLAIVAENGPDDRPDPNTIKSFIMESSMGLSYNVGTWHHPTLVLDTALDLCAIDTQIRTGADGVLDERDIELLKWEGEEVFGRILVPPL